jgi:hypothetical protein
MAGDLNGVFIAGMEPVIGYCTATQRRDGGRHGQRNVTLQRKCGVKKRLVSPPAVRSSYQRDEIRTRT